MSIKSRLLKKREIKPFSSIQTIDDIDLLGYIRKNKEIKKITAYSYNAIFEEKNGINTRLPISFSSEEAFLSEISRISNLFEFSNSDKMVKTKNGLSVIILQQPVMDKNPVIIISRQNTLSYKDYYTNRIISSEIAAYLKECISQKANIFVIGKHDSDKNAIINFLLQLTGENNCNLIYDFAGKISSNNSCNIYFSESFFENIDLFDYDNVFCSDINVNDLVLLFRSVMNGHQGFNVSLSLNDSNDILQTIRNLVLLNNNNLFEENADFLTSSCMDVLIFIEQNDDKLQISKISELSAGNQNTIFLKDIFSINNKDMHVSTGNASRFYNKINASSFIKEYLEEGHIHSYVSGITANYQKISINNNSVTVSQKENKVKNKLKNLKKEKLTKSIDVDNEKFNTEIDSQNQTNEYQSSELENNLQNENEFVSEKQTRNNNDLQTESDIIIQDNTNSEENENDYMNNGILASNDDFTKEDIINNTLFNNSKISNILEDDTEEDTEKDNIKPEVQDDFNTILKATEKEMEIADKYSKSLEPRIIEEPQLFSEISEETDNNFGIDDFDDI